MIRSRSIRDSRQSRLRRSDFTSCEDICARTRAGGLLLCPTKQQIRGRILSTPTTVTAATGRLEGLRCPNIEVVIDKTHGIRRLAASRWGVIDPTMSTSHARFLIGCHGVPLLQTKYPLEIVSGNWIELFASRVCQLRRLCHLFGYDRTLDETVAGGVDGRWDYCRDVP